MKGGDLMSIRIMVDDRASWLQLYDRLREIGLLKGVSREDMDLSEDLFPMEFFIDAEPMLAMLRNPGVRMFKGKIDDTLTKALEEAIL